MEPTMTIHPQLKPTREGRVKRESIDWKGFKFPRPTTERDRKYARDVVRNGFCSIKGRRKHVCGPVLEHHNVLHDFAHVPTGGHRALSKKAPERAGGICLCRYGHMEQHAIGWPRFEEKYGIDARALAREVDAAYVRRTSR